MPIQVVPLLERAGRRDRADGLFRSVFDRLEAVSADYPRSAHHHHNAARLAAHCGRELDKALAHARRAADLDAKNTAFLDTLAEAHFRRGETAEAVAAMKRCIELEPKVQRHRERLARLEAKAVGAE